MRIDSPSSVKSWLKGNFEGRFKGYLEGSADSAFYATSASYAREAGTINTPEFVNILDKAIDDPQYDSVFDKLRASGKLIVSGGIRIREGNVEIDSGSLRIRKVILEYLDEEEALQFRFIGAIPDDSGSEDSGSEDSGSDDSGSEDTGSGCNCNCPCCRYSGSCPYPPPPPPPPYWPPCPHVTGSQLSPSIDVCPGRGTSW